MVNCCVPHCTSYHKRTKKIRGDGGEHVSYHEFPGDATLLAKWLKVISRENFVVNVNSNSSRVCSKHFTEDDFVICKNGKRLKKGSIPSVFHEYPVYMQPSASAAKRREPKKRRLDSSEEMMEVDERNSSEIDAANVLLSLSANERSSTEPTGPTVLEEELKRKEFALQEKSKQLNAKILEVRRLKKQLTIKSKKLNRMSEDIKRISKILGFYKNSVHHQNLEKLLDMESADYVDSSQLLLLTQLKFMFSKSFRWPERVLRECILLQAVSPRGYRTILERGLVNLPSKSTLKRYTGPVVNETGVSSLIRHRLQEEVTSLKPEERFCSLIIDEVALKPQCIYDQQLDCFLGEKSNSDGAKKFQVANRMLCFLLYGLSTKISVPCAYYFTSHLTGKELYGLATDVLHQVEDSGFNIVRFVADNHKSNVAMFRCFGKGKLQCEIPHPCDVSRSLFFSFDQNHIIKNVRSLLLSHDMADGDEIISGKFLKELYKLQKDEKIKPVRNLTLKHVDPTNLEKMNVRRAVLIFSPPVTAALQFLRENYKRDARAYKFRDCDATVEFLQNFYEWYSIHDVCNRTQHRLSRDSARMHFFDISDERFEWLNDFFLPYLSSLEESCKAHDPPLKFLSKETYEAIQLTTHSTIKCTKYLLQNGFQYVLTRYFNSDAIESFFGSLRQMCGNNDMLDVRATLFAIDKILKTGLVTTSKHSSVGVMKYQMFEKRITHTVQNSADSLELPDEVMNILSSLKQTIVSPSISIKSASVAYVAGYLVRTLESEFTCEQCLEQFSSPKCSSPLLNLISHQDRGGLKYPATSFVSILEILLNFVEKAVLILPTKNVSLNLQKIIIPELLQCPILKCNMSGHAANVVTHICKKFLNIVLKNIASSIIGKPKVMNKPLSRKVLKL